MKLTKIITFILLVFCINACFFISNDKNNTENKSKGIAKQKKEPIHPIDKYTDKYTITPNTKHPKFKPLLDAFKKQEHRFEFDLCDYKYNDKSFFWESTPKEIIDIFGEPDEKNKSLFENNKIIYYRYEQLKLTFGFYIDNMKLDYIGIRISDIEYNLLNSNNKIFMFRNIPYRYDMTLNEYMAFSDLNHDKLGRKGRNFYMFQKECPPSKDTRVYTYIDSEGTYDSKGGGNLTWRGDFMPQFSSPIKGIGFYKTNIEDFKK